MQEVLVESAIRATLIAGIIGLVLYVMRIKTASARHAVWAGVVVVMLLLPAFLLWGPKASLPVLPRRHVQNAGPLAPMIDRPVVAAVPLQASTPTPRAVTSIWTWPTLFAGVYLAGLCTLLLRLAIGTMRVRWLLRGTLLHDGRLTHASCTTPVTVGWVQPTVILPADWSGWPQARLDAILVHEQEHARRRDPLFQWIALLNRALFWFHPVAWWLERQLSGLAEEACDVAVLAQGHDPRDYSEYLLDLARSVEHTGTRIDALGMAMPGAFLPQRIKRMLSGAPVARISRARKACVAAMCAAAVAILAAGTLVRAQPGASRAKFEVISIRPSAPPNAGGGGGGRSGGTKGGGGGLAPQLDHGKFIFTISPFALIAKAYGIQNCGLLGEVTDCPLIAGTPDWAKKDRFDIQAKSRGDTFDYTLDQFMEGQTPILRPLLQAMLADRFGLKVHTEQRQVPIYALTVTKNGPKLKKAAGEMRQMPDGSIVKYRSFYFSRFGPDNDNVRLTVTNRSVAEWIALLSILMDRPIVDRTGLEGEFDFTIEYERDPDATGPKTLVGPPFMSAFQEQLGLKFEATKGAVDVLVIDGVDRPSEN